MNPQAFEDFESAGKAVLSFLHRRLGFSAWMITRVGDGNQVVLQAEDHGYGIVSGSSVPWQDTYCIRMLRGEGPRIAPRSAEVPAYAASPANRSLKINAYVGLPITRTDGSLFGTLCAIDPQSQPEGIQREEELIGLLAAMLGTVLEKDLRAESESRRAERLEADALTDAMTALYNRRGWDQLLALEEDRCRRYGHSAAVLAVDLDGLKKVNDTEGHEAGDGLIKRAASALKGGARLPDVVARLGGDEFAVLAVQCDRAGAEALRGRVRSALDTAKVGASLGLALREPSSNLGAAWKRADELMYVEKRAHGGRA